MHTSTDIKLGYNKAFQWIIAENIHFIGYLNSENNLHPSKEFLNEYFRNCNLPSDFREKIRKLNGIFGIIINCVDFQIIASDTTRFFPVFYAVSNDSLVISDDIHYVRSKAGIHGLDNTARIEFLSSAFTGSHKTLFKGISQVRPAEIVTFENNKVRREYYYSFSKKESETNTNSYETIYDFAEKTIDIVFERLLKNLHGKKIALPLSGGYDSRLIACKLKEYGFNDVTCFTYGRRTKEVEVSKKVAETLGYPWYFVEYTNELIHNYHCTPEFREYYEYASRGTSMFFLQEYPAVKNLVEKQILSSEHLALPGHSGDLLRGALLVKTFPGNSKRIDLPNILLEQKYIHSPLSRSEKKIILKHLREHLNELDHDPSLLPYSILEDWEMKERTSKYIFNSSHVFTFFNIKTYFPIWDKNLIEYFRLLPFHLRKFGALYSDILENEYFKPNNVLFKEALQPSSSAIVLDSIKKKIRPHLPSVLKTQLLIKNDWTYYGPMTEYLLKELRFKNIFPTENHSSYLYRILNYYLMMIQ